MQKGKIVLLCTGGDSTRTVYRELTKAFGDVTVIMEDDTPRSQFLRRRVKKLGLLPVFGQALFMVAVVPVLRMLSKGRLTDLQADSAAIDVEKLIRIDSVNSPRGRSELQRADPAVVVVNGTRIVGKSTLECVDARFINMHAGITPLYRGVHGGYWALAEDNAGLVGTTVHFVDTGIDTGGVIAQAFFEVGETDSFVTYPYLHTRAGVPLLIQAVKDALNGNLRSDAQAAQLPSRLRYHPTIWEYLYYRFRYGAK